MENNVYIKKMGILEINPIWVSINNGKYKLYFSNPIELSTKQKENTIKLKEMWFIHSKKIDVRIEDTSVSLEIAYTNLYRWLGIGLLVICLSTIFYLMSPWRSFLPIQVLSYILFGYLGVSILLLLIFKRKDYFKVRMVKD